MKRIYFIVALFAAALVQHSFAQDTTNPQPSALLTSYYNLKDALVTSDAIVAGASSEAFVKELNGIDKEIVKVESRTALLSDANAISQSKELKVQRERFASLSVNMFTLAKTVKLSTEPVCQQTCPMIKAYWLSSRCAMKHLYYGSAMLSCGSVKVTF